MQSIEIFLNGGFSPLVSANSNADTAGMNSTIVFILPNGTIAPISGSDAPIYIASINASITDCMPSGLFHASFNSADMRYLTFFSINLFVAGLSIN